MSAPWLMIAASFLFATMGVCVKLASHQYSAGEMVFYRGLTGVVLVGVWARWQGATLRTKLPAMHAWRGLTGVVALCLWFYAIGELPLATAMTLNYMSSVWMALFLVGGTVMLGGARIDHRLIFTVLLGFAGVALVLRPTIEQNQLWAGLVGLLSGMIAATAYLQVTALGRAGEPDYRIVFYFSVAGVAIGAATMSWKGMGDHTLRGVALLLAIGVLATAAQLLMTRAYATGRVLVNASLQYLGIAYSFAYGVLLFDDRVTAMALAGMTLIVGAGFTASLLHDAVAKNNQHTTDT
jgi:drug/metabolite transporter (DMT)-like permease